MLSSFVCGVENFSFLLCGRPLAVIVIDPEVSAVDQ